MIAIGIDIAKRTVDVCMRNKRITLNNNEQALKTFFGPIQKVGTKIVMEATGRYHRQAHSTLTALGFDVMVINPYQSRHFAKSMNVFCKTDKVDAAVLSQYAQRMDFSQTPVPTDAEERLMDLIRYLDDLKKMVIQYENRLEYAEGMIKNSLMRQISSIKSEIKLITKAIKELIKSDERLKHRSDFLTSIPGVGDITAAVLLSLLKELGELSNKEVTALAGLAPMNCDSGNFVGKRHIQRGRHDVRRFLYVPVLGAATMHNPILKIFYDKLIASGKPTRVAMIACMRKLVVTANALLRKGEKWSDRITGYPKISMLEEPCA